jgi:hypothetical protein
MTFRYIFVTKADSIFLCVQRGEAKGLKNFMEYLNGLGRVGVAPIYDCDKDFEFACMGNVAIAKALGFKAETIGGIEKIIPYGFETPGDVRSYGWYGSYDGSYMRRELDDFIRSRTEYKKPLGGGSYGPLTVVSDIVGVSNLIKLVKKSPDTVGLLLDKAADFIVGLAKEEERLGADFFWIAEPVASLFPPKAFEDLSGRHIRRIFESVGIASGLHVCGDTMAHTEALLKTGANLLSIDYMTDLKLCLEQAPEDVAIMGNVSPILIWQGSKDEIRRATEQALNAAKGHKNFILSSGCLIPGDTPPENVDILISAVKNLSEGW